MRTVITLTVLSLIVEPVAIGAQGARLEETTRSVRRALERLPYYGVFDFMAFNVERGVVTLVGFAYHGTLKAEAEAATRRADGVDEVANRLEILPPLPNDDRIRWATFHRIYTDEFLSRYAPGGALQVRRAVFESRLFPGTQPFGTYPIHIIVKHGRTTLVGVVDSEADRRIAEMRAREVTGVFSVENILAAHGE